MRNKIFASALLLSALPAEGVFAAEGAVEQQRPNVLFIYLDDLTYDGLSALGNPDVISPNMDAIIESGVNFTNAYNMGAWNGAVSMASRSQMITGRSVWGAQTLAKSKYKGCVAAEETFPQVMRNAGYKSFFSGKWHINGIDPQEIFDVCGTVRPGMPNVQPDTHPNGYYRPVSPETDKWSPYDKTQGGYWLGGRHWSEVLTEEAVTFMDENKESKEPLFIYLCYNAPHDPRQAPKSYLDMYDVDKITLPESFVPLNPIRKELAADEAVRDEKLAPFPRTEYSIKKNRQEYYALITHLDDQIGLVMKTLRESGLDKNTIIVFTADNGLALGKHGLMGKQTLFEHSTKMPFVIAGKGVAEGEKRNDLIYIQDAVPTLYDMLGIKAPATLEFKSQLALVESSKAEAPRKALYGGFREVQRMVRDDRYKLIFVPNGKIVMLFDLKRDPQEMNNLYGDKKYDKVVAKLAQEYLSLSHEVGDTLDIKATFPEIFKF